VCRDGVGSATLTGYCGLGCADADYYASGKAGGMF
jgi:hypothetical protein